MITAIISSPSPSSLYFKTKVAFNLLKLKEKTGLVLFYYSPVALYGTESGLVTMRDSRAGRIISFVATKGLRCGCFSIHWNCIRDDCMRRGICRLLCSITEPSGFLPMDWKWFKILVIEIENLTLPYVFTINLFIKVISCWCF